MRARATLLALAAAAALAATAGAALAEEGPPTAPSPEQIAIRCDRAQHRLDRLNVLAGKLAERITKVQAKIDSGELSEDQLARAQHVLERLQTRQTRLGERIQKLGDKIAEKCSAPDET